VRMQLYVGLASEKPHAAAMRTHADSMNDAAHERLAKFAPVPALGLQLTPQFLAFSTGVNRNHMAGISTAVADAQKKKALPVFV